MKSTPVWDKKRPKGLGKPKALTPAKKAAAKSAAKKAGRPKMTEEQKAAAAAAKAAMTPEEFSAHLRSEITKWSQVVDKANIRPD